MLKDPRSDLAMLRLKDAHERFPTLDLANSDALQVGDVVLAIGNPFGVGQTVTHGIVSALARTQVGVTDYQFFIQTDAAINPGNSGGALVDMQGRLVGINTLIFSRSGGSQGIGFAIPANMVRVVVASAKSGGDAVKRPWLGAKLQAVTADIADSMGLKRPAGALIASVTAESPAARAGLKAGDVIVAVDGQEVDDPNAFDYRFATKPLGGTATLGVLRGGRDLTVSVALETAPDTPRDEITIRSRSPFSGAKVANLSPALADELQLDETAVPGRRHRRRRQRLLRQQSRLPARRRDRLGQRREDRAHRRARTADQRRQPLLANRHPPRPAADHRGVQRLAMRAKKSGPTLFAAAGLDKDAPRPLADRLRPHEARRGGGPGPSARPGRGADADAVDALARLTRVLGPARHRQDHGGAAAWRRRPTCISSRFPRSSPASPT